MNGTLTNLNVNPCKMCMPMGAVTALYGIKRCMSILHGSQGCSTYIRRHMATHYNEPVDIASSSLTEEGTVYGGEKNLVQGLLNLIRVYQPEVIGVATTCLAETIGEDIRRMIDDFYLSYPQYKEIRIIPISSAGYSGTQYEGFQEALYQIVRAVPMEAEKNRMVNVVTGHISPADTRVLKELLESFGIDYILLPDLSDNLDGVYQSQYDRLPSGGTSISQISKMAGARMTIELSAFTKEEKSVGKYLQETYGVPYVSCNAPVGLRDNDQLIKLLKELSGRETKLRLKRERGRYLDAMIDAHKYCGEVRAVIYGEPDFVWSMVRFCRECGILPVITATGTRSPGWQERITEELQALTDNYELEEYIVLEEVDFQTLEEQARKLQANLLIGNSDGRRMAEKLDLPLVRRGFPVHDHLGGQRLRSLGYEGTLTLLDEITNAVIDRKETSFRGQLYDTYYKDTTEGQEIVDQGDASAREYTIDRKNLSERKNAVDRSVAPDERKTIEKETTVEEIFEKPEEVTTKKTLEEKTDTHPCYSCKAHDYARMHLPIAPRCNISCNYCLRKYDCPNESRPGVTTKVLQPEEALQKFLEVKEKVPRLTVVGIAGPGDALANFPETKKTLELIREKDSQITFCLSTNGLMLPQYVEELVELGVTHVTVTMNAVDPKIGAKIYKYVDYMGVIYYGEAAAAILLANQLAGLKLLADKGILCKVNIVMLKGINDQHIPEVVKKVKELGVIMTNILPMIPVKGSAFEALEPVNEEELFRMRTSCGETLKQMFHCRQCRADAIGTLNNDQSGQFEEKAETALHLAVATKSGILVDQHFGHATEFDIYEFRDNSVIWKEQRVVEKYCGGPEECEDQESKLDRIQRTISDCSAVIVMRVGDQPREKLEKRGIRVFTDCDQIETCVRNAVVKLTRGGDCSNRSRAGVIQK